MSLMIYGNCKAGHSFQTFFGEDGIQLAHVTMAVKKKFLGI